MIINKTMMKLYLTIWSNDIRLISIRGSNTVRPKEVAMVELKLGNVESQFADIIWNHEPIPSGELVKICEKELEWKKSTTYTMLKRLCERGIFKNENGIVSSLMTKAEFGAAQSEKFVEDTFEGSLPAFLAAFTTRKKLSKAEIDEIRQMIDSFEEE